MDFQEPFSLYGQLRLIIVITYDFIFTNLSNQQLPFCEDKDLAWEILSYANFKRKKDVSSMALLFVLQVSQVGCHEVIPRSKTQTEAKESTEENHMKMHHI